MKLSTAIPGIALMAFGLILSILGPQWPRLFPNLPPFGTVFILFGPVAVGLGLVFYVCAMILWKTGRL